MSCHRFYFKKSDVVTVYVIFKRWEKCYHLKSAGAGAQLICQCDTDFSVDYSRINLTSSDLTTDWPMSGIVYFHFVDIWSVPQVLSK